MTNVIEQPVSEIFGGDLGERSVGEAVRRGIMRRCPQCGRGKLFDGYLKINLVCKSCGLEISGHRADDAPPYITIVLVGHVIVPVALAVQEAFGPPMWMQFSIWLPAVTISALAILPSAKGAMIGLQWANRMHGFAGPDADPNADV